MSLRLQRGNVNRCVDELELMTKNLLGGLVAGRGKDAKVRLALVQSFHSLHAFPCVD